MGISALHSALMPCLVETRVHLNLISWSRILRLTLHLVDTGRTTAKTTALMTTVQALFPVMTLVTAKMIAATAALAVTTVTAIPLIVDTGPTTMMTMTMMTMMTMTMMMTMTTTAKVRRSPKTRRALTRLGAVRSVRRKG